MTFSTNFSFNANNRNILLIIFHFVFQENFCFIRGSCVLNGTETGSYNCSVCNPMFNRFDWTIQHHRDGKFLNMYIEQNFNILVYQPAAA